MPRFSSQSHNNKIFNKQLPRKRIKQQLVQQLIIRKANRQHKQLKVHSSKRTRLASRFSRKRKNRKSNNNSSRLPLKPLLPNRSQLNSHLSSNNNNSNNLKSKLNKQISPQPMLNRLKILLKFKNPPLHNSKLLHSNSSLKPQNLKLNSSKPSLKNRIT